MSWPSHGKPTTKMGTTPDTQELPTDEQLAAEAARQGDGPAFAALVERYRARVWRICFRLLGNEHDAHDAAQEVFVRLFFERGRFAGQSKFSTWVHAVALRTCLTLRRGRSRRQRHEQAAAEAATRKQDSAQVPAAGLHMDLERMLESLDEEDRALVILKHAEGYSYEELAAIFELSESACKMRVARAREKIQSRFGSNREQ